MAGNNSSDVRIELITDVQDFIDGFEAVCNAFGHQTNDGIWTAMNPGWDTSDGKAVGAAMMIERWRNATTDRNGNPNTMFLKATLPDPNKGDERVIGGMAIWVQASVVEGCGDAPAEDYGKAVDLEALYPGNETEQRYLRQVVKSLHKRRIEVVKEKANDPIPAVMVLDMCAVDPAFQRKGLASRLVEWGLDEAQRRGGLEATTEGSLMGRHVYLKLGFHQDGPEIGFELDEEFANRPKPPSNLFMRTGSKPSA